MGNLRRLQANFEPVVIFGIVGNILLKDQIDDGFGDGPTDAVADPDILRRSLLKGIIVDGAVVMVGSPCGSKGFCFKEHAYTASKGGIMSLMRVMALDYAPHNIRVNGCTPGFIDTPMNAHVMVDPELLKMWSDTIPMKRPGTSEETAAVILFLASDEAAYVLGSEWVVDGGQMAG